MIHSNESLKLIASQIAEAFERRYLSQVWVGRLAALTHLQQVMLDENNDELQRMAEERYRKAEEGYASPEK